MLKPKISLKLCNKYSIQKQRKQNFKPDILVNLKTRKTIFNALHSLAKTKKGLQNPLAVKSNKHFRNILKIYDGFFQRIRSTESNEVIKEQELFGLKFNKCKNIKNYHPARRENLFIPLNLVKSYLQERNVCENQLWDIFMEYK